MRNARKFTDKMRRGKICLGTCITFSDATVTEALCGPLDFVFVDMEHNALTLETVQSHLMATKGTDTAALVRVPGNDPDIIKPVLDSGADGVVVPLVRTVDDVRRAVAACRYPPEGIRGMGPRRPTDFGRSAGPDFLQRANAEVIAVVQIEHVEALNNLDEILAVPGLTAIIVGPNDLAGSMGFPGQPRHPDVLVAIDTIIAKTRQTQVLAGIGIPDNPEHLVEWGRKGMQWLMMGADWTLLLRGAQFVADRVREDLPAARP
jgi:2-keto-3-deoxy-L-rhamnonate aldolase RhmA